MQRLHLMDLPVLPNDLPANACYLVSGSTYYYDRSKTATELWDIVLVFSTTNPDLAPTAYRFLSGTQFAYGG